MTAVAGDAYWVLAHANLIGFDAVYSNMKACSIWWCVSKHLHGVINLEGNHLPFEERNWRVVEQVFSFKGVYVSKLAILNDFCIVDFTKVMLAWVGVAEKCSICMGCDPVLSNADTGPYVFTVECEELITSVEIVSSIVYRVGIISFDCPLVCSSV